MVRLNLQQIVLIFVFLIALGKSFSLARQVKEVTLVETQNEFAAGGSNFSSRKEIVDGVLPNVDNQDVQTSAKVEGRKMSIETMKKQGGRSSKKLVPLVRSGKGYGEDDWKDNFMAFSADYRSPKSHPPKNN